MEMIILLHFVLKYKIIEHISGEYHKWLKSKNPVCIIEYNDFRNSKSNWFTVFYLLKIRKENRN